MPYSSNYKPECKRINERIDRLRLAIRETALACRRVNEVVEKMNERLKQVEFFIIDENLEGK